MIQALEEAQEQLPSEIHHTHSFDLRRDLEVRRKKLDALLNRFDAGLDPQSVQARRAFWQAWNSGHPGAVAAAWPAFRAALPALQAHAHARAAALARQTDLAKGLVTFCENRL